jgi:hypothetical protein
MAMVALMTGEMSIGSPRTGQVSYASGCNTFFIGCFLLALAFGAIAYLARR